MDRGGGSGEEQEEAWEEGERTAEVDGGKLGEAGWMGQRGSWHGRDVGRRRLEVSHVHSSIC